MAEKSKESQSQPQPQIQSQQLSIQVPEDLRNQFQEFSIRSNGYDVARRDYNIEVNKTLTALLQKVNIQAETIRNLQQEIANFKTGAIDNKVLPIPTSKKK